MSSNPEVIGSIVFACIFGGAMIGMFLRDVLPEQHLNAETKDVVKLAMGLIGTMTALLLGLLVASTKASYDARKASWFKCPRISCSSTGCWLITAPKRNPNAMSFATQSRG